MAKRILFSALLLAIFVNGVSAGTNLQLWYNIGRWFKCPNLNIGTEIEFSYNFNGGTPGTGFMCNPCLGIKWTFD